MTTDPPDRRAILRLLAAGAAASVAACQRPDETIHPLTVLPEGEQPGQIRRYATALPLAGYLRGVTGLVVDGRPVKLEGLAAHPASLGATDAFTEAAILDLYDPQRLNAPAGPPGPASWPALSRALFERVAPRRGKGLAILSGRITSPTLLARIAALRAALPGARHVRWEPFNDDAPLAAAAEAFGRPLTARPRLADADVILCLDADPLGPGPDQVALARAWATRRRRDPVPRLFVIEASPTATGALADRRAAAGPDLLARACHAIRTALVAGEITGSLGPLLTTLLSAAVPALTMARGRALVLVGDRQPAAVHAFAAWLNGQLSAPIDWIAPVDPDPAPHHAGLADLTAAMHAGRVDTLLILDANPVHTAPPALGFAQALARVPLSVAATRYPDETAARCTWSVPLPHPLEEWHDGRAPDGTATIAQPLIRPFYDTRTAAEVIDLVLDPAADRTGSAQLRETWSALGNPGWRDAVATGVVPGTAARPEPVRPAPLVLPPIPPSVPLILTVQPSPSLWDGRFATNAWAQETPDPLTKEVWGASLRLHPADMAALGVTDGELVRVERGPRPTLPVRAMPGQARGVATMLAGHGRSGTGAIANGVGVNAWALDGEGAIGIVRSGGSAPVVTTQHQFALDGDLARLFPLLRPGQTLPVRDAQPTLIPNPPATSAPPQYAMAIDTDVCIGCNACVVACQAENNVPAIGPGEMAVGRDMHWLRVDRYDQGNGGGFQPVPCMQCEKAPCEPVCPVEASVHDAQGLNLQVYNRCVGTRTCQANCPYKVRRFNFRDYAGASLWGEADDASITAQRNPDVSVRARGVMEKCTYCVQRISAATRDADAAGEPVGPVVTACAAACPTRAITFGMLADPAIRTARADPRHYALLEELGTRPRTTYLARRIDPDGAG